MAHIFDLYSEKTPAREIITLFYEIEIAEANGDVRSLTGRSQLAVSAYEQYRFD